VGDQSDKVMIIHTEMFGLNWLRIVSNGFDITGVEPSGSATRELVN
jgi:hypothetical protein